MSVKSEHTGYCRGDFLPSSFQKNLARMAEEKAEKSKAKKKAAPKKQAKKEDVEKQSSK